MKLPPIEYFYGNTPMSLWISRCKPFVPKYTKENDCIICSIPQIQMDGLFSLYLDHQQMTLQEMMFDVLGVKRDMIEIPQGLPDTIIISKNR